MKNNIFAILGVILLLLILGYVYHVNSAIREGGGVMSTSSEPGPFKPGDLLNLPPEIVTGMYHPFVEPPEPIKLTRKQANSLNRKFNENSSGPFPDNRYDPQTGRPRVQPTENPGGLDPAYLGKLRLRQQLDAVGTDGYANLATNWGPNSRPLNFPEDFPGYTPPPNRSERLNTSPNRLPEDSPRGGGGRDWGPEFGEIGPIRSDPGTVSGATGVTLDPLGPSFGGGSGVTGAGENEYQIVGIPE